MTQEPNPDTHVKCPDCRELVLMDARKCKHCGCSLIPQRPAAPLAQNIKTSNATVFWVVAGAIALLLLAAGEKQRDSAARPARSAASPTAAVSQITAARDAIGCGTPESMDRLGSMAAANDRSAMASMLLNGQCEKITAGTVLDAEDVNLLGPSRYRVRGTGRSLYVSESTLR